MLGLKTKAGVPDKPPGPALAIRVKVEGAKADVRLGSSDATGAEWTSIGSFEVKLNGEPAAPEATARAAHLADAIAAGLVGRLVRAELSKPHHVNGKAIYKVRIANASPLVLNGLALAGPDEPESGAAPSALAGLSLPPHCALTVPATGETVERLGLKRGVRVVAADLSGL